MTEARLFLRVTPCRQCGKGPLQLDQAAREEPHISVLLVCACRCAACGCTLERRFKVDAATASETEPPVINPTAAPSKLVDAAQWLTLYHLLLSDAEAEPDRQQRRRLKHLAGLSIDEALKFYGADNDLPPATAFFSPKTVQHARRHPEVFARQKLLALRSRLPRAWNPRGPD